MLLLSQRSFIYVLCCAVKSKYENENMFFVNVYLFAKGEQDFTPYLQGITYTYIKRRGASKYLAFDATKFSLVILFQSKFNNILGVHEKSRLAKTYFSRSRCVCTPGNNR